MLLHTVVGLMSRCCAEAALSSVPACLRYISVVIVFEALCDVTVPCKGFAVIELVVLNYTGVYKIVTLLRFSYAYEKRRYYLFVRNRSFCLANS